MLTHGTILWAVPACVLLPFSGQAWWVVLVGELLLVLLVIFCAMAWTTRPEPARTALTLFNTGKPVMSTVLGGKACDGGGYELALSIRSDALHLKASHRCDHPNCTRTGGRPGSQIPVLVAPDARTWGVLH
ncbi:hypothetical protein SAMN05660733_01577 [Lentzea albidocapillata]|uniref:Uncharacterized protein n=1 Tax=Lentzea albidocapillata TaxID=40571 RepID=A0A1W2BWJ1_9PSEU|nr:hypothetical protein SAMN05660733_01577 [Lentzea albidocapillata]